MSNARVLDILCRNACSMVRELNEQLDDPTLYLTSCAGYFRLYGKDGNADRLLMEGYIDIHDVSRLITLLEGITASIKSI